MIKNLILLLTLILVGEYSFAEDRKVIVVVDTGIHEDQLFEPYVCKLPHLDSLEKRSAVVVPHPLTFLDRLFPENRNMYKIHGRNIINIIGSKIDHKKYCILSIRFAASATETNYVEAIKLIKTVNNVVAVNLSITGGGIIKEETKTIADLIDKGIKVVCAAGNNSRKLTEKNCNAYPACLKARMPFKANKNLIVVGNHDTDSSNSSTFFKVVDRPGLEQGYPPMTGTSQSTANYTGELFNGKERKGTTKRTR